MINQSRSADSAVPSSLLRFRPAPQIHAPLPYAPQLLSRLSMSQMTTCRWSFLEDVLHYRRAGLTQMAVWRPKLIDFGEERSVELLRDAGLRVSSLGWAGGFTGSNGYSFDEAVEDAYDAIRTAAALGAESVTIISGAQDTHIRTHARRLLIEGLTELLDFAGERGITLALQPMHRLFQQEWTFLNSLDESLEILTGFDHPYLRMAFGTYHLWQDPRLFELLPVLVPFLASVQVSDWRPPRCDNDRVLPGDGEIPLLEILSGLHQAGYGGTYEIEIWSTELWKSDHHELLSASCQRILGMLSDVVQHGELTEYSDHTTSSGLETGAVNSQDAAKE